MLALGHPPGPWRRRTAFTPPAGRKRGTWRELGFANPMAVIPNPVAVPSWIDQIRRREGERFRAGFLGRFHPIKNLESLIRAWGSLNLRDAELLLIGDGPEDYAAQLKRLAAEVGGPGIRFTASPRGGRNTNCSPRSTSSALPAIRKTSA